jgi:hypothetical protein
LRGALPARSSSEVEKQAALNAWKLNVREAHAREVFERRSSAVPSVAEGKQAGLDAWKLIVDEAHTREEKRNHALSTLISTRS